MMFVGISTTSCSDDLSSSIYDTTDYPLDRQSATFPLDTFLKANFLEPYNLRYIYRMEDVGADMNKNLTPVDYEQSVRIAVLSKYLWYDIYEKLAAKHFLQENSPRIIHLIGSKNINRTRGTEELGVAEGGLKISLFNINNLRMDDIDNLNKYAFHTMHHEFTHILDQTHQRPNAFNTVSNGSYNSSNWKDTPDSLAIGTGFVSPYASSAPVEDWAETLSTYVTLDSIRWNQMLNSAKYDWETVDIENLDAYNKLIKPGVNYDTIGYYQQLDNGDSKVVRRVCARNSNGNVELDESGNIKWLNRDGINGQEVILKKVNFVRTYLKEYYKLDIDSLRKEVQTRTFLTDSDGKFVVKHGALVSRLTEPAPADPSRSLIDYLVDEWVNVFKKLQK